MADAPAAAPASGTSSTPPAAPPAAAATPPAAPASSTTAKPAEPSKPVPDPAKPAEPAKADAPSSAKPAEAKPPETAPDPLAWTMPEDFKPPESTVAKFMEAIKTATKDGKFEVSPQKMVDLYVDLARDANTAWQKQIEQTDANNKAACEARFTPEQLAASESAVGWFSSYEPSFHDFAKRQLNDPVFVNAMRLVGEALQEEDLIPATPPGPAKRTPAQIMGYDKKQ